MNGLLAPPAEGWSAPSSPVLFAIRRSNPASPAIHDLPLAALVEPILPLERVADGFAALTSGYPPGRDVIKVALRGGAG